MIPLRTNIPYGFCQCGCGEKTNIAYKTDRKIAWIKGEPIRFIIGHANRQSRIDFSDATPFKIDGVYCKLLSLTRGLFAIVDATDYDWLDQWKWYALFAQNAGHYAVRHRLTKKKITGKHIYMHRFILGLEDGDESQGDHKNGVTLDHRRKNLRPATEEENKRNCKIHCTNTSGRKGVYYEKSRRKWVAQIKYKNKSIMLGRRDTFEEACAVREAVEKKYHGEFARRQ